MTVLWQVRRSIYVLQRIPAPLSNGRFKLPVYDGLVRLMRLLDVRGEGREKDMFLAHLANITSNRDGAIGVAWAKM